MSDGRKPIKTIRGDESLIESTLDGLDTATNASAKTDRCTDRYRYRRSTVAAIKQPGDSSAKPFTIQPRNISEGGMAFLHGGFVHDGSRIAVQLVTLHGSWRDARGSVVGCRYLANNLHEVRVRFDATIDPSEFSRDAIRFNVLLVDDDPSIVRIVKALLGKHNAAVDDAENGEKCLQKTKENSYDLVLMDVEMPVMDGITCVRKLRERGYSALVVAATGRTEPEDREACLRAGFDDYVPKPYTPQKLSGVLDALHREPLFSTLANDPAMVEVVQEFLNELPDRIRGIETALRENDLEKLIEHMRRLKGDGASYGYEVITDTASDIEKSLLNDEAIQKLRESIDQLIKLCLHARITP